jgi:hypothetical protein
VYRQLGQFTENLGLINLMIFTYETQKDNNKEAVSCYVILLGLEV